jgi:hypothetical protein
VVTKAVYGVSNYLSVLTEQYEKKFGVCFSASKHKREYDILGIPNYQGCFYTYHDLLELQEKRKELPNNRRKRKKEENNSSDSNDSNDNNKNNNNNKKKNKKQK